MQPDDVERLWIEEQRRAGLCPVVEAHARAFALDAAGSSQGRDAWLRLAARAARLGAGTRPPPPTSPRPPLQLV